VRWANIATHKGKVTDMGASFRELTVWQRAFQLTLTIYKLTATFPDAERFGLTNQLRRAAVSVVSNIAEGSGRSTKGEYFQFLGHARGSVYEVEAQLLVAGGLKFGSSSLLQTAEELCCEVGRMLRAMMKSLQAKGPST
jgi:four helix bundle protein